METRASHCLGDIANFLGAELQGDADYSISHIASLPKAGPDAISFVADAQHAQYLTETNAGCVLLTPSMADKFSGNKLLLDNPYWGFAKLTALFKPTLTEPGIHSSVVMGQQCHIGENVHLGAHVVLGDNVRLGNNVIIEAGCFLGDGVEVGEGSHLYPNVTLYHDTVLGKFGIIHAGVVIGSDGFGFAPADDGSWQKIHQLGAVSIGKHVEIGAGTTIDRGALDDTCIGDGVKIDNQVQIAHNVSIGNHTAIAACSAIAGSTHIGEHCTIAGAVGIIGHLTITDRVHITAMTLVTKSIRQSGSYSSGVPMGPNRQWRKNAARFNQLDQLATRLRQCERRLDEE